MSQSARVGCIVEILQCTGCLVDAEDVLCKVSCGRPFRRRLDCARTATTPIIRHILGGVERRTRRNVVRMRSRRGWTVYALPQRPLFGLFWAVWKEGLEGMWSGCVLAGGGQCTHFHNAHYSADSGRCGKGCGLVWKRVRVGVEKGAGTVRKGCGEGARRGVCGVEGGPGMRCG